MGGIDTGGRYETLQPVNDGRPTSSSNTTLFDSASTSTTSVLISVRTGRPLMLIAYMMEEGAELTVEGVSVGSRGIANGGGCCNPCNNNGRALSTSDAVDIRFREPMTLGGNPWKITNGYRRLVITLPGQYILQLNDQQYLGQVHVELVELGEIETRIPDVYAAGVIAGGTTA